MPGRLVGCSALLFATFAVASTPAAACRWGDCDDYGYYGAASYYAAPGPAYSYYAPPVYYAVPPVYYAPPPIYAVPPPAAYAYAPPAYAYAPPVPPAYAYAPRPATATTTDPIRQGTTGLHGNTFGLPTTAHEAAM